MIAIAVKLIGNYDIRFENHCGIFVDGANPIRALNDRVDEVTNYEQQISYYRKSYYSVYDLQFLQHNMFVTPIPLAMFDAFRMSLMFWC